MSRKLTYSGQSHNVIKGGKLIGCHQAQVWDENGKSFAIIEPTINEEEATETAKVFASAFKMKEAIEKVVNCKGFDEIINHYPQLAKELSGSLPIRSNK
jgi:hypothetical protein